MYVHELLKACILCVAPSLSIALVTPNSILMRNLNSWNIKFEGLISEPDKN